VFNSDTVVGIA